MRRDQYAALLEARKHALADAQDLHRAAEREQRTLAPEEQTLWEAAPREVQRLSGEIDAAREFVADNGSGGRSIEVRSPSADYTNAERSRPSRTVGPCDRFAIVRSARTGRFPPDRRPQRLAVEPQTGEALSEKAAFKQAFP